MTIRTDNFVLFPGHVFHDILDAAGIAPGPDVVGRVRILREHHDRLAGVHVSMRDERAAIKETCDAAGVTAYVPLADRVRELARRLDASERDRVGLLATLETVRGERNEARSQRDSYSLSNQRGHDALTKAGVRQGDVVDRVSALIAERAAIRNVIADFDPGANPGPDGWEARLRELLTTLTRERDALRALARPDVGLPEGWSMVDSVIFVGGVSYPAQGPPGNYVVLHVYDSGKTCWGQSGYATPAVYAYLLARAGVVS